MSNDLVTSENAESCQTATLLQEDSPAKTFRRRTRKVLKEWTDNVLAFGRKCSESFASYDLNSSLWRTSQACFTGDLAEFWETWPPSGMTRSGKAFQRPRLAPLTSESGFFFLPTPQASDSYFDGTSAMNATVLFRKETIGTRPSGAKIGDSLRWCREFVAEQQRTGGELNPEWREVLMGYPNKWTELGSQETPSSRKSRSGSGAGS
jgi:hypothetical protein